MRQHRSDWTCERCGGSWTIVVSYEGPAGDPARTLKRAGTVACLTPDCPRDRVVLVDPDWQVDSITLVPKGD
jgi:hypothetical protein